MLSRQCGVTCHRCAFQQAWFPEEDTTEDMKEDMKEDKKHEEPMVAVAFPICRLHTSFLPKEFLR